MRDLEEKAHGEAVALKWNEAAAAVTEGLTGDAFVLTRSEGLWAVRTLDAWRHLNAAPQAPATGDDAVEAVAKAITEAIGWNAFNQFDPEHMRLISRAAIAALANHSPDAGGVGEDAVETAASAFAKVFYGPGFDPFHNPEAFDLVLTTMRAALNPADAEGGE